MFLMTQQESERRQRLAALRPVNITFIEHMDLCCRRCRKRLPRLEFSFGLAENKEPETKGHHEMQITITNEQKIKVTLTPKTDSGKPAQIDGVPSWTVSTGDATLDQAPDGMSVYLVSGDAPGTSEILVEADADLGEGVETISATITLNVEGAKAVNLGLAIGEPEAK